MSGYRCVNFTDLCRLCSSAGNNNIHIFTDESLQKKITECLPINLNEKDKLPKVICTQCLEYVQVFSDFRQSCSKAQKMLESCLTTSKLRNGGQVYIKDEVPTKKVLKPIQSPSTKLIPNLCNIVSSTPTKQVKTNILSSPNQPDFLSSIMQAVGIQTSDDASENISFSQNIQPQQNVHSVPQYTFTLDGGTLKSGQIQYKIENAVQPQQQLATKPTQEPQQLDEFLKLNKKHVVLKKSQPVEESKNKKPKFNLILQASPQKQKIGPQVTVSSANKTFGSPSTLNTPTKSQIQIHNIEKIMPPSNQTSPTKQQLVVPIMVRNDGSRNSEAAQLLSQALSMSNNQSTIENKGSANPPFAYVQMKIQPNADGQLTLTPATPVQAQQHLQLSLSPQQFQQLSFQTPTHQQTPALTMQPQITVTQMPAQEQADCQTQTPTMKTESMDEADDFNNQDDDYFYMDNDEDDSNGEETQEKTDSNSKPAITITKKKTLKPSKKIKSENLTELQSVQQEHSDIAKKQLNQLTSFNTKRTESEAAEKNSDLNLTVCDVCKKVFKRKEFLMQHLKSHIGLRPFKCDEPTCNKSFSRKEHLLRHVVSHTGKKMFNCDVCKKLFSRKDNLNKHRRIHPEPGNSNMRHSCSTCGKAFSHRAQLGKHQLICDGKSDESGVADEVEMKKEKEEVPVNKKLKIKPEKKPSELSTKAPAVVQAPVSVATSQAQQQQPQILTILQQPQQQVKMKAEPQAQQIILSMSQAQAMIQQQQQKAVYTFPTNLILNANGSFMTNAGEVVGNFKFDGQ